MHHTSTIRTSDVGTFNYQAVLAHKVTYFYDPFKKEKRVEVNKSIQSIPGQLF